MSSQLSDEHVVTDVLAAEEVERAQVGAVPREGVERLRVQKVALGENLNFILQPLPNKPLPTSQDPYPPLATFVPIF